MKRIHTWLLTICLGATALFGQGTLSAQQRPRLEFQERPPVTPAVGMLPDVTAVQAAEPVQLPPHVAAPPPIIVEGATAEEPKSAWLANPPHRTYSRPGNFPVPPKGPGYYSLLDVLRDDWRTGPPKYPYAPFALMGPSFYDADFRYVDDPKNQQTDPLDRFHRVHLGDNWLFATGGEFRWRHMNEVNSRLTGVNNTYDLTRTRVFTDLWYRDAFRVYSEFISAHSFWQDLPALPIDRNHADWLNLFVDVKVGEVDCKNVYARVGRQELLLGSQRLVSPPDWANTRRTFEGFRVFRAGEKFDWDLFWTQPVIPNVGRLDTVDNNQTFAGAWTTYRPQKGVALDSYYLYLDNANHTTQNGLVRAPTTVHTLGFRYSGDKNGFLWDTENMLQLGERGSQSIVAGSVTAGAGYNFAEQPLNPTVWVYYDYATGDRSPNAGNFNTFNQHFPFGHYYMGYLDLVGRQNIHDLNFHLWLWPTKWVALQAQYHLFQLDSSRDALYGPAGAPLRRSPLGTAGRDVGDEVDLIANFHLGPHTDVLVGYSKLFAGDFLRNTGPGRSPELFYLMYNVRW